jgi:hypothetical protein
VPTPAEQRVDRLIEQLAFQVPQRRLDSVDHSSAEPHAAPEVAAVVHPSPQLGNVVHRLADEDRLEEFDD